LRPELVCFLSVVGDHQIAGRSAFNLRHYRIRESICVICVICGQMGWMGGLRVFVFAAWAAL